jgi:uncharacterized protein YceH (UPF0502 family)
MVKGGKVLCVLEKKQRTPFNPYPLALNPKIYSFICNTTFPALRLASM